MFRNVLGAPPGRYMAERYSRTGSAEKWTWSTGRAIRSYPSISWTYAPISLIDRTILTQTHRDAPVHLRACPKMWAGERERPVSGRA